jgi:hypothetical protein
MQCGSMCVRKTGINGDTKNSSPVNCFLFGIGLLINAHAIISCELPYSCDMAQTVQLFSLSHYSLQG